MEDAQETLGYVNEEALLPDGWDNDFKLFDDGDTGLSEEMDASTEESDAEFLRREAGEEEAPEASDASESGDQSADVEEAEQAPSGQTEPQAETPKSRKYHLKVNREERDVELTDDEVLARLQKSYAFDAIKEKEQKQKYRDIYNEEINAGMTQRSARQTAIAEVGKEYSLTDEEDVALGEETPTASNETPSTPAAPSRDFMAEYAQVKTLFNIDTIPDEVILNADRANVSLLQSMLAYRQKQEVAKHEKTAADAIRENRILKQNAASAARAPVKGVTGGGTVSGTEKSSFEKGFDSDPW